ncbi:MAG: B12-binding domain-containing radical SAM protein, partial [Thermoanaerobaculia bacterium]
MRVGIFYAYMDNRRRGKPYGGAIQPITGALIAALLPPDVEVDVINDNSPGGIDWSRDYDLVFLSSIHSDFDRARQISHYFRRRGAKTVYGGFMASTYTRLCSPFFDAVVVGDAEGCVPRLVEDFRRGELQPLYLSSPYDPLAVPVPRFDLLADRNLVPLTLEATRGCPFTCEFCALTGIGTRFHVRPVERIVHEVVEGRRMLRGRVPAYKLRFACFVDNNIGGNPGYLDELCAGLLPLDLRWGSQITFNVVAQLDRVKALSRAGCRAMFVGLESFNPATLADMNKLQNTIHRTREVLEQCRRHGILVGSGLMLSPLVDGLDYIESVPERLAECGLYLPSYVCFESPIPGTPHFHRLAAAEEPAFLPNALLRDFSGYTLTVRPRHATAEEFVAGHKWLLERLYAAGTRLRRFAHTVPGYVANGWWATLLFDLANTLACDDRADDTRSYLAGTDAPPADAPVPFTDDDFRSEAERRAILEPWRVTDEEGRV